MKRNITQRHTNLKEKEKFNNFKTELILDKLDNQTIKNESFFVDLKKIIKYEKDELISHEGYELFLKKMLILLISLLEINKLYFDLVTDKYPKFVYVLESKIINLYIEKLDNFRATKIEKLPLCKSLLKLTFPQLLSKIQIKDLYFYLNLNRIYVDKKIGPFYFKLFKKQPNLFNINIINKAEIICSKNKRKDEIMKFAFKFLRKKILLKFGIDQENEFNTQINLKNEFNKKILLNNKILIEKFYTYNVSKKDIKELKKFPNIFNILKEYFEESLMQDLIKMISEFDHSDYTISNKTEFLKTFFCNQQKRSLILQDVIIIYNIFSEVFHL